MASGAQVRNKTDLWHRRLAHMNMKQIHQLAEKSTSINLPSKEESSFCEARVKGKMHHLPHHPRRSEVYQETPTSALMSVGLCKHSHMVEVAIS